MIDAIGYEPNRSTRPRRRGRHPAIVVTLLVLGAQLWLLCDPTLVRSIGYLATVAIVLPWVMGSANANATMLMSILMTLVMASIVLVVLKLSYPFSGSSGLLPTAYTAFIDEVSGRRG